MIALGLEPGDHAAWVVCRHERDSPRPRRTRAWPRRTRTAPARVDVLERAPVAQFRQVLHINRALMGSAGGGGTSRRATRFDGDSTLTPVASVPVVTAWRVWGSLPSNRYTVRDNSRGGRDDGTTRTSLRALAANQPSLDLHGASNQIVVAGAVGVAIVKRWDVAVAKQLRHVSELRRRRFDRY